MNGYDYSIALFLHLISLLAASVGAALAGYAALHLRAARSPAEVARWGRCRPAPRRLRHVCTDEVRARGLSERARRLLCDPLVWTAKALTWTLMLAVIFVMSTKPPAWGCAVSLLVALLAGAIAAVPMWRGSATDLGAPGSIARVSGAGLADTDAELAAARGPGAG